MRARTATNQPIPAPARFVGKKSLFTNPDPVPYLNSSPTSLQCILVFIVYRNSTPKMSPKRPFDDLWSPAHAQTLPMPEGAGQIPISQKLSHAKPHLSQVQGSRRRHNETERAHDKEASSSIAIEQQKFSIVSLLWLSELVSESSAPSDSVSRIPLFIS
jgi:hypothetical protein